MADIINLADRRKKEKPTVAELAESAISFISSDWERFARNNRLNDFFISMAGVWAEESVNYLSDLNAVAKIESKLRMNVVVRSPYGHGHLGWRASFALKSGSVTTPDLPFETYARCFNILLFIKLKRDLVLNDMTDEL